VKKWILVAAIIGLLLTTPLGGHTTARLETGVILLVFTVIATFLFWLLTGCRRSFEEELLSERNQERNQNLTMVFILVVAGVVIYMNNR